MFSRKPLALSRDSLTWSIALLSLLPLMWLLLHDQISIVAFVVILLFLVAACSVNKAFAIYLTLAYLFLLGDERRLVNTLAGFPKLDPLLVVGPIISILLALPILMRLRLKDSLSKVMLALMVVMLLEIVNPRQGPIAVGLAGAMFYVVPLLWFWIGREYGSEELLATVIYKVVVPLAVLAAILGLCQTYVGFLPWESAWIAHLGSGYHALSLGDGFIRPFGFSVNGVEYTDLLLVASVSVLAAFFAGRRAFGLLFPLLVFALFLSSSRTSIVKLLFAVAAAWALSSKGGKGWAVRLPFALAVGFGVIAFSLAEISSHSSATDKSAASESTQHQVEGLEHPLDSKHSTAGMHASMILGGFTRGLSYPIGYGLGAVTMGSSRLGGDETAAGSSEVDISDAFASMGIVGGLLYLWTIWLVLRQAIAFGRNAPKYLGLPALAILAAMGGGWIAAGQYAMGPLVWLVIGVLCRHTAKSSLISRRVAVQPRRPSGVSTLPVSPLGTRPYSPYRS